MAAEDHVDPVRLEQRDQIDLHLYVPTVRTGAEGRVMEEDKTPGGRARVDSLEVLHKPLVLRTPGREILIIVQRNEVGTTVVEGVPGFSGGTRFGARKGEEVVVLTESREVGGLLSLSLDAEHHDHIGAVQRRFESEIGPRFYRKIVY